MAHSLLLILTLSLFASFSCSYRTEKEAPAKARLHANMSFSEVRAEVLGPKCARCHGWMGSEDGVKPNLSEISARIQSSDPNFMMPPPGQGTLTPEERGALLSWIQRALGGVVTPVEPPPPVITPGLNYAYVKQQVFPKCMNCHDWAKQTGTYEMLTPERREEMAMRVRSEFEWEQMPPPNKPALTEEEKTLLLDWLKAGAPKESADESSSANEI